MIRVRTCLPLSSFDADTLVGDPTTSMCGPGNQCYVVSDWLAVDYVCREHRLSRVIFYSHVNTSTGTLMSDSAWGVFCGNDGIRDNDDGRLEPPVGGVMGPRKPADFEQSNVFAVSAKGNFVPFVRVAGSRSVSPAQGAQGTMITSAACALTVAAASAAIPSGVSVGDAAQLQVAVFSRANSAFARFRNASKVDGLQFADNGKLLLSGNCSVSEDGGDASTVVWKGSLSDAGVDLLDDHTGLQVEPDEAAIHVWDLISPTLYRLNCTNLSAAAAASDSHQTVVKFPSTSVRFGFRNFSVGSAATSTPGTFLLNGRPVFLRGNSINPPGREIPTAVGGTKQFALDYMRYMRNVAHVNALRIGDGAGAPGEATDVWYVSLSVGESVSASRRASADKEGIHYSPNCVEGAFWGSSTCYGRNRQYCAVECDVSPPT